ncbi:MAG: energy-coupling factor ABC transporter ATP-binding protein [Rhodospirillaceae bacterium]
MNIILDHVTVRFQDLPVLSNISISLSERRIGVIGDNGSGKSTFARLLNGLLIPDEGTVTVDGLCTHDKGNVVRRHVGFLFQNPDNQIVMPTVSEDLALGLKPLGLSSVEVNERVVSILEEFGLLHLQNRSAHLLSGGEKQLVSLAGVMIVRPDILVCDEPTTLLDRRNATRVMRLISSLACSVVTVTHQVERLVNYDRILVISNGSISFDGKPSEAITFYESTQV